MRWVLRAKTITALALALAGEQSRPARAELVNYLYLRLAIIDLAIIDL